MTDFTPHTLETADAQGRDVLEQVQKNYGFVPNLLGTMAHAPATAKGYLALGKLVGETSFDATQQQVILLTVSRYNECEYCIGAHSAISAMQKLPLDVIESIRNDEPIADEKLEALRVFTRKMVDRKGWLSKADIGSFLAAGYGQQQILEVVLGVAMKTISNYTNHIAGTTLDDAFADFAWQTPRSDVA
ncbi:MAG: carboxymuconolactone decarboxylase family protein [Chromatiales bacterium]|nr:MAG: carboxymuconolactone decarboxylase family protein [Chromatiales bacterium]